MGGRTQTYLEFFQIFQLFYGNDALAGFKFMFRIIHLHIVALVTVFIVLLQIHPLAKKDFKDFPFRLKIVLLKVDKHYQY